MTARLRGVPTRHALDAPPPGRVARRARPRLGLRRLRWRGRGAQRGFDPQAGAAHAGCLRRGLDAGGAAGGRKVAGESRNRFHHSMSGSPKAPTRSARGKIDRPACSLLSIPIEQPIRMISTSAADGDDGARLDRGERAPPLFDTRYSWLADFNAPERHVCQQTAGPHGGIGPRRSLWLYIYMTQLMI
jgi:hypothetical protein